MIRIAITLIHNKTDSENAAQIEAIKLLVDEVKIPQFYTDENENSVPVTDLETGIQKQVRIGYRIKDLNIDHMVKFFQVFPFGVTPPPNHNDIDSNRVFYGKGDEDKTNDHPRFFNWGLKRGTDYGADLSLYLEDVEKFDVAKFEKKLEKLADKNDKTEFTEDTYGKIGTLKLLKQVGQLKEDRSLTQAITDIKTRVVEKGLKNG